MEVEKKNVSQYRQNESKSSPLQVFLELLYPLLSASLGGANDTSVHLPTLSPLPLSLSFHSESL